MLMPLRLKGRGVGYSQWLGSIVVAVVRQNAVEEYESEDAGTKGAS